MLGADYIHSLLREALRHCPAGADGDIYLTATEQALTRFANNRIHQNVAHQDAIAHVRVAIGKRQGRAVTNNLSESGAGRRRAPGWRVRPAHARGSRVSRYAGTVSRPIGDGLRRGHGRLRC